MFLRVSGKLVLDVTGVYAEAGTYNGQFYYRRGTNNWYIWFDSFLTLWFISHALGALDGYLWGGPAIVLGTYTPGGPSSGIATVEEYVSWRNNYLQAEWKFDENGTGTIFTDTKAGLFPILCPSPTVTSDYSAAGKFGRALSPNLILPVSPYLRTADIGNTDLVYDEFSIRCYLKIIDVTSMPLVVLRFAGSQYNYHIQISNDRMSFSVFHPSPPGNISQMFSNMHIGFYGDSVWREYLFTFQKQAATPRMRIFIKGIDESDYSSEGSFNESVRTDINSYLCVQGNVGVYVPEYVIDQLQIFNKAMIPEDFIVNELVDQSLIYPGIPQLAGF